MLIQTNSCLVYSSRGTVFLLKLLFRPKKGISCSKPLSTKALSLAAWGKRDQAPCLSFGLSHTHSSGDRESEFSIMGKEITKTTQDVSARMEDPFISGCCSLFQVPMELCGTEYRCLQPLEENHKLCSPLFREKSPVSSSRATVCFLNMLALSSEFCPFFEKLERNSP